MTGIFETYILTVRMNVFVLLGNSVYGRWFLDGNDPEVRLVAVILSKCWGWEGWMPYPYNRISHFFQTVLRDNLHLQGVSL